MLIKLDIAKAYDKLRWNYLEAILNAHSFSPEWVEWVMALVSSPFYSIILNGYPTRLFPPSSGNRQGDLLSPFLFFLAAEGLSNIIQAKEEASRIRGLVLHKYMKKQTHQQFMDDTMLMGHPSIQEARAFKSSLSLFAKASSLAVNA